MLDLFIVCGLVAYLIIGLVSVAVVAGQLLDGEDFVVRHLIVAVAFLPITLLAVLIASIGVIVTLIGDTFRNGRIHRFLEKPIKIGR